MPEEYRPFVTASGVGEDGAALAGSLEEHGYLFLRRLLPAEPILETRRAILELCREAGWLHPASDLLEGRYGGRGACVEGEPSYMAVYRRVIELPSFLRLPHHPVLLDLTSRLLGGDVLVHPRKIGRITFPGKEADATPPHQDHALIKGAARTYTVWMPLGDCPRSLGGLAVLAGSHRAGLRRHVPMRGTGGTGVQLPATVEWHSSDMGIGDCLLFHSHTVHRALPNVSGGYLRLSVDNRYQLADDDVDPSSLRPHYADA